jgi:tripartite-type tricarboxylate transporter receptor subunit TctC
LAATLALAAAFAAAAATAQSYPAKTVRVINPFAPGGGLEIVLRPALQKITESTRQSFILDSRSGANGIIGTEIGVKSPPDGYTLIGATSGTITINPGVYAKLPFDPERDLAPISNVGLASFVMVVHPSLAPRNVREFIALAKNRPADITYGSPGIGSPNHLGAELFLQATGTRLVHVPYKGSGPLMTDLRGGHVVMAFDSTMATLPHIKAGKLRPMGIAAKARSPVAPEIPTIAEAGGPEVIVSSFYGLLAPAATPREVITKLHGEVVKAIAQPDLRERYVSMGLEPVASSPEEFGAQIHADIAKWAKVARVANVRAQ